jgi:uncharacterized protein
MAEPRTVKRLASLADVSASDWDACAGGGNPFVSHAFLHALEVTGCVSEATGWTPFHLLLEDNQGRVLGAQPGYLKTHSQGEYVFDHGWAEGYQRAGGRYYPKLLVAAPFSPVPGPRLLLRDAADAPALIEATKTLVQRLGLSSAHWLFVTPEQLPLFTQDAELLVRHDQQFHWSSRGYSSFEDFLADLASRKRKTIRKEREAALEPGIAIEWLSGQDITEAHWDAFFRFYQDTGARKWGRPYLNRRFFSLLGETMPDQVLLIMARRQGRYIAGALNLIGADTLYGRYWGCIEEHPCLHFEVCYYQAIDYAIRFGLSRVEAGAQGPHKLARGYEPTQTTSVHWIAHEGFREAVAHFLEREKTHVEAEMEYLGRYTPFRKDLVEEQD